MTSYQILYWHGIPVQVRAKDKGGRISKKLADRFMEAVDRAAMLSKNTGGDAYAAGFVWGERLSREGTAEEVAAQIVAEIESQYPEVDYRAVAEKLKAQRETG